MYLIVPKICCSGASNSTFLTWILLIRREYQDIINKPYRLQMVMVSEALLSQKRWGCSHSWFLLCSLVFCRSTCVRPRDSQNSLGRGHLSLTEMAVLCWWLLNSWGPTPPAKPGTQRICVTGLSCILIYEQGSLFTGVFFICCSLSVIILSAELYCFSFSVKCSINSLLCNYWCYCTLQYVSHKKRGNGWN